MTDVIRQKKYRKGASKVEGVVSRGETDANRPHTAQIETRKGVGKVGGDNECKAILCRFGQRYFFEKWHKRSVILFEKLTRLKVRLCCAAYLDIKWFLGFQKLGYGQKSMAKFSAPWNAIQRASAYLNIIGILRKKNLGKFSLEYSECCACAPSRPSTPD